jgi:hypothetical protein
MESFSAGAGKKKTSNEAKRQLARRVLPTDLIGDNFNEHGHTVLCAIRP